MQQPATATAGTHSLRQRLESLGLSLWQLASDGRAHCLGQPDEVQRLIAHARPFHAAIRQHWPDLPNQVGELVEIWPGTWVVPLARARKADWPIPAAIILGTDLLHADQLRLVCDSQGVDYQTICARLEPDRLLGPAEASRLATMLAWMYHDTTRLDRSGQDIQAISVQLSDAYEELSLLYKLSSRMTMDQPPEAFLGEACRELREVAALRWLALQLVDETRLEELAGASFTAGSLNLGAPQLIRLAELATQKLDGELRPTVIPDPAELDLDGAGELAQELLVVPLVSDHHLLGLIIGGDRLDGQPHSSVDLKLCDSLAHTLTIFLDNRMLYEDMEAMFLGTLHALTSAIDAKDSYTRGHSERVALMSRMLAEAAGLDAAACERVYISGLVHDVGKIGVPETVLCKPGKLTDEEYALIKLHPEIGARILEDIRPMRDLLPGVLQHHERWDGRGYPHGLAGREVPLFGRIVGLADSFDAMSSNRTYRRARPLEKVLEEITNCAGQQFDPELAAIFVNLDFGPFHELIEKHQNLKSD
ncbi:MAG: HD-GYP domain-containing protein [Phycisphaeraceae bacterium]